MFPGALIGGRLDVPVNSGNLPATMLAELPIVPAA